MGVTQAVRWGLDALFPRACLRCGAEGAPLCVSCAGAHLARPPAAGCPFCGSAPSRRACRACRPWTYLDGAVSAGAYADPVIRGALRAWKYHGDEAFGSLARGWARQGARGPWASRFDAVMPVPLHSSRRRERGFDQAEELALEVAATVGAPMRRLLVRSRNTTSQARRSGSERKVGEMDGVFRALAVPPARVLLVDDVLTSGATMDAAARCLKEAGAGEVWGLVVAMSAKP